MKQVLQLAIFIFCFILVPIYAASTEKRVTNTAEFIDLLHHMRSMRADFVQTTYDTQGKAVQTSYGRVALVRPNRLRWEVTRPIAQLIIANQKRLWIYDPDLEQVTIRSLARVVGEAPALLLSHIDSGIENDFVITTVASRIPGERQFNLVPKNADSMFTAIQIKFRQNQISEMYLQNHLGHTSVIFQHMRANVNIPATLFIFNKLPHVDVIDETR
jgi:outer membrane lipoprotein carrier protein